MGAGEGGPFLVGARRVGEEFEDVEGVGGAGVVGKSGHFW